METSQRYLPFKLHEQRYLHTHISCAVLIRFDHFCGLTVGSNCIYSRVCMHNMFLSIGFPKSS